MTSVDYHRDFPYLRKLEEYYLFGSRPPHNPREGLPGTANLARTGNYLDFELNRDEQQRRAYRICRGMGLSNIPSQFHYQSLTEPVNVHLPELIDA